MFHNVVALHTSNLVSEHVRKSTACLSSNGGTKY